MAPPANWHSFYTKLADGLAGAQCTFAGCASTCLVAPALEPRLLRRYADGCYRRFAHRPVQIRRHAMREDRHVKTAPPSSQTEQDAKAEANSGKPATTSSD